MFKVIRVSEDYRTVVAVETENGSDGTNDPTAVFYLCQRKFARPASGGFIRRSWAEVRAFLAPLADGMGYGELPAEPFANSALLCTWRDEREQAVSMATLRQSAAAAGIPVEGKTDADVQAAVQEYLKRRGKNVPI